MSRYERRIHRGLARAYAAPGLHVRGDLAGLRAVVFSDHHRGRNDAADDFRPCKDAYHAALEHYRGTKCALVLLGDVEELWECRPKDVLNTYRWTLKLEQEFARRERYVRVVGNHDDEWRSARKVRRHLRRFMAPSSPVVGSVLMTVGGSGQLLFVHGHQGTFDADLLSPLSMLIVRYLWRPFQRATGVQPRTPATDHTLRPRHELAMYRWARRQPGLVLIAGHTHHAVFPPYSPGEGAQADAFVPEGDRPCYFNSGCCSMPDGSVTGLEISGGRIALARWTAGGSDILREADLGAVLKRCRP